MAKNPKPQSMKDRIRGRTLGSTTRRFKSITLPFDDDGDDETIVIVAPSLAQLQNAQEACGMEFTPNATGGATAILKRPLHYRVEMIIACVHAPEFGPEGEVVGYSEPIYSQMDKPVLMSFEDRGWFKRLGDEVTNFSNLAPENAAKNLKATHSAASASA